MTKRRYNPQYRRGEFGLNQNLAVLVSLCCFILAVASGSIGNNVAIKKFEKLKDTNSFLSDEKKQYLSKLQSIPTPSANLLGNYRYLVDYGSGHLLTGHVNIDNQRISRRIEINHQSMSGSAEYDIVGSTIQYKDIDGDKYLFNENGTAIDLDTRYGAYLEFDGDMKLFIQTKYAAEDYIPLNKKTATPVFDKIKSMTLWQILQTLFLIMGIVVLMFVLYKIIQSNNNRKSPYKPDQSNLAA